MKEEIYDTVIVGAGPAGAAAAVYAARKKLKTLLIAEEFGGQSAISASIENWIGEEALAGVDLAAKLETHVRAQEGIEVRQAEKVVRVTETAQCRFAVTTEQGATFETKTLIVASGARRRRLNVPGESTFAGRGVAFCSTCDALFFRDLDVAVVGSGNAALETVVDLQAYAKRIYLLVRGDRLKGDPITQERVTTAPQVSIMERVEVQEILGEQAVTGLRYKDNRTGEVKALALDGVFVEIGSTPNSDFIRDLVETNEAGEVITDPRSAATSRPGVFAAGDVTMDPFKQNNIAAGDGVRAALSAYNYLLNIKKFSPCAAQE